MKILLIGHSGSGKSTLATKLATQYQIPLLHLDTIAFAPHWKLRPSEDIVADLEEFLNQHDNWVIDGIYSKHLFERRLEEADVILYLNFNRWTSLYRILKRRIAFHGKVRPSAPVGCKEKLDWAFIKFALLTSRRTERQKMYREICQKYADKVIILHNQKEMDCFLEK